MTEHRADLRLLLAEDNDVNQRVALLLLRGAGFDADVAVDGTEVLDLVEANAYDAIFMDVQMPHMDGIAATREIRRRWPDRGTVIIGLTAEVRPEDREACLAAGMDRYLTKPLTREKLLDVLDALTTVEPDRLAALRRTIGDVKLAELIDECLRDARALLGRIDAALENNDDDELARASHMLSSTASIMGADDLSKSCVKVENAIRSADPSSAHETARGLRALFDDAQRVLRPDE